MVTIYSDQNPMSFDPLEALELEQEGAGVAPSFANGFAVVRVLHEFDMPVGRGTISLDDVPPYMDPSTVRFSDLDRPDTRVLEQRLEFDLASAPKLLGTCVGKPVYVAVAAGPNAPPTAHTGTLVSASAQHLVLLDATGIRTEVLPAAGAVLQLPDPPTGLRSRPSLHWLVDSPTAGRRTARVEYQTPGLAWNANYSVLLAPDRRTITLSAWATLLNTSGATLRNAQLRLIAGKVNRIQTSGSTSGGYIFGVPGSPPERSFREESISEFHRYTRAGTVDLPASSVQQLQLFAPVSGIPVVESFHHFEWERSRTDFMDSLGFLEAEPLPGTETPAAILLTFENTEAVHLGIPLPKGRMRGYEQDSEGLSFFVADERVDDTPRGTPVRLSWGALDSLTVNRWEESFVGPMKGDGYTGSCCLRVRYEIRNYGD
ncbi:MAG: hypothetical protein JNK53_08045, partial [Phycisphaerae bacterium]|nr:hypothetical protein [Phycisphaerae bacterium]